MRTTVLGLVAALLASGGARAWDGPAGAGPKPAAAGAEAHERLAELRERVGSQLPVGSPETMIIDGPSSLARVTLGDPQGDVVTSRGDLVSVEMEATASGDVIARARVAAFDDPSISADWVFGLTGILWYLDTDGDGFDEYYAGFANTGVGVMAAILDSSADSLVCEGTPGWNSMTATYTVRFRSSCIGNPARYRFRVGMVFDDWPSGAETVDLAPDRGWAGPVNNDAVSPPRPSPPPSTGAMLTSLTPTRVFDTRSGEGGVPVGYRSAGSTLKVKVTGRNGVPSSGVAAVSLNVTAVDPLAPGYVTVYPCGPRPNTSNLNFAVGETAPNAVIAPVSSDGQVCFYADASTHLLADVSGWLRAGSPDLATLTPTRVFDTRTGEGGVPAGLRPAGSILKVKVTGRNGVPSSGVGAVALNVTATGPLATGFVTVYPCGSRPGTSSLNYVVGATVPNFVLAPVSVDGHVCFYTEAPTNLIADVSAWFSTSTQSFRGVTPARVFDTRLGASAGSLGVAVTAVVGSELILYITGGRATTIDQVPWQVRLLVADTFLCGGSLIADRWVLTAAHCVDGFRASSVLVHAGLSRMSEMTTSNGIVARRVIVHPGYRSGDTSSDDIALVELSRPPSAGRPIALYNRRDGPAAGTPAVVSGWGDTFAGSPLPDQVRRADVVVRAGPGEPCGTGAVAEAFVAATMICASGGTNAGACSGDSGGPLAINDGGTWRVAGVVSFGRGDCPNSPTSPTVFTRVSAYVDWIAQYVPGVVSPPAADPVPSPAPGKIGESRRLELQVVGRNGIPATGVAAVAINLTVTEPEAPGYATVYPCGSLPNTSNVNFAGGQTRANAVIAPVSARGTICVYASVRTHVIVDVNGWFPSG